ncbi:MAG: zf-HC2 domain-containing protein [Acidobacteriota bacterium]|nr:zf-HC2 domain-containing protein [Acidobacteriota bacterium]
MMTCEHTQKVVSSYIDGELPRGERASVDAHLWQCPVCRLRIEEMRVVARDLAFVARPVSSPDLAASINRALMIERAARRAQPARPLSSHIVGWVRPRLMPYTVGAFASLLLFVGIMSALRPQLAALQQLADASRVHIVSPLASGEIGYDVTRPVSLEGYAATRTSFAVESPSLNPRGALAALAWTPSSGRPDDDDMIVVADVYGNGSASLAAVVEPPRNPRMLDELQDALRKNPAFVPASLDRRPQTMRVVFVLQKMKVEERSF